MSSSPEKSSKHNKDEGAVKNEHSFFTALIFYGTHSDDTEVGVWKTLMQLLPNSEMNGR